MRNLATHGMPFAFPIGRFAVLSALLSLSQDAGDLGRGCIVYPSNHQAVEADLWHLRKHCSAIGQLVEAGLIIKGLPNGKRYLGKCSLRCAMASTWPYHRPPAEIEGGCKSKSRKIASVSGMLRRRIRRALSRDIRKAATFLLGPRTGTHGVLWTSGAVGGHLAEPRSLSQS